MRNTVTAFNKICPRCCSFLNQLEVEVDFGEHQNREYLKGDKVVYPKGEHSQAMLECTVEEGYAECIVCHKDFFLDIFISYGIINDIVVNFTKKGHLS